MDPRHATIAAGKVVDRDTGEPMEALNPQDYFYLAEQMLVEKRKRAQREARTERLYQALVTFIFWLACFDVGAVFGYMVVSYG